MHNSHFDGVSGVHAEANTESNRGSRESKSFKQSSTAHDSLLKETATRIKNIGVVVRRQARKMPECKNSAETGG
jgi:hypothetical protein